MSAVHLRQIHEIAGPIVCKCFVHGKDHFAGRIGSCTQQFVDQSLGNGNASLIHSLFRLPYLRGLCPGTKRTRNRQNCCK